MVQSMHWHLAQTERWSLAAALMGVSLFGHCL